MMMHKLFDEAGALCYGSLMLTTNMNKAKEEQSFEGLRETLSAQKKRTVLSGGLFYHNSRAYRHD